VTPEAAAANPAAPSGLTGSVHLEAAHALPVDQLYREISSGPDGLTSDEARRRLTLYGGNRLPAVEGSRPLHRFLAQFDNVLIYVLLAAAAVTVALAHWVDTAVILGVVVINAVLGYIQEGKAEQALDAIRKMLSPQAIVVRDGQRITVSAEELVPGDLVFLQSGDRVPADLRLVHAKGLQVQEAALTGESLPVEKRTEPVSAEASLGDRASMVYSGTLVTHGQGTGMVVATGVATEIGRIGGLLAQVEPVTTPLLRQMARFARWLTGVILALAVLTLAFGVVVRGYGLGEMFLAAVALAVAAILEGLPAVLTITLAIGVERMARRNAIVRRLPAVETLGSVNVICSDKTGTLTKNEMTAQAIATAEHQFEVSGVGYDPHGAFSLPGRDAAAVDPERHPLLVAVIRAGVLCNEAMLRRAEGGGWVIDGDPTEGALLTVALKAGLDLEFEREAYPRTDIIPFESEHRFMATLHHDHEGRRFIYVKGAPERVLGMCARERTADLGERPLDAPYWYRQVEELAARGRRILAVATKAVAAGHGELRFADVEGGLTLLGLFGLIDPPRAEAIAAIAACQSAGIRVKMITGDHGITARAIAGQLGLSNDRDVITGPELAGLSDDELRQLAPRVDIFARASPEDKLRLVEALQADGAVVAMTGDGVNDAPALKRADVGVAMGQKGTEAAKEAAEMVLTDDNFASIAHAVEEGRTVYDNLKKSILFMLPTNGGEALTVIAAIMFGGVLPITPVQILWVNMVTAITLSVVLAFEPAEPDIMQRPPRTPGEPILSRFVVWRTVVASALFLAGTYGLFLLAWDWGLSIEEARTLAVNALVAMQVFYLFNVRYLGVPSLTFEGVVGTRAVLIAIGAVTALQFLFTYAPIMHTLFETRPLTSPQGLLTIAVAMAGFTIIETEKALWRFRRGAD
jgi:magnesium-transporting ATPase (P-type)